MDGFLSAAIKVDLAEVALNKVITGGDRWRSTVSLDMDVAVEPTETGFDAVVRLANLPDVPAEFSFLLDEVFHHARSALDHVVWQLVMDSGKTPKRQAFPVLDVDTTQTSKKLHLDTEGISSQARDLIKSIQPYGYEHGYRQSYLWRLHRLDVVAKHRSILPTALTIMEHRFAGQVEDSGFAEGVSHQLPNPETPAAAESGLVLRTLDVPHDYQPPVPSKWLHPSVPELWITAIDDCAPIAIRNLQGMLEHVRQIIQVINQVRPNPVP